MTKSVLAAASIIALSMAAAPACATKGFVREEVGTVNAKVDTLSGTLGQTQQRVGQAETRIGEVDQKAEAAGKSAMTANTAATAARGAADKAAAAATTVSGRVDAVDASLRKLVYAVTLSEDQGNFTFGSEGGRGGGEVPRERVAECADGLARRAGPRPDVKKNGPPVRTRSA